MRKWIGIGLGLVALVAGIAGAWLWTAVGTLETEQVTADVHLITGMGGNVGVLATSEGAVVVDSMTFRRQGEAIRREAEALAGGPVKAVINTHYHIDHSHGNPGFEPGTRFVSTQRTLEHLHHFDSAAADWQGVGLPTETFETEHELRLGGKTARSIHLGRAHTDGDLVVLFVEDRVLHTGDLVFNQRYPNIDLEAGGSIREWSATLERMLELEFDRVIPGHGPVTDREGIRRFQRFIDQLWSVGEAAAREGRSLAETQESSALDEDAGYGVIAVPFVFRLDRPFVLRRAWEEATGAVQAQNPPRDPSPASGELGSETGGR